VPAVIDVFIGFRGPGLEALTDLSRTLTRLLTSVGRLE
jgi:hypothetical protein